MDNDLFTQLVNSKPDYEATGYIRAEGKVFNKILDRLFKDKNITSNAREVITKQLKEGIVGNALCFTDDEGVTRTFSVSFDLREV